MREKVQGLRSIIGMYKIDRGDVKNSIGNGEANELIRTSHGHEPRVGIARRKWGTGQKGQRRKIQDN